MRKILLSITFIIPLLCQSQVIIKNGLYEVVYSEEFQQPISISYSYPDPFEFKSSYATTFTLDSTKIFKHIDFKLDTFKQKIIYPRFIKSDGYYIDGNGDITNIKPRRDTDSEDIGFPETNRKDTIVTIEYINETKWKVPTGIKTSDDDDYASPYDRGHLVPAGSFKIDSLQNYLFSYLNCALMHQSLNRGLWRVLENHERELAQKSLLDVKIILLFSDEIKQTEGGAFIPNSFVKILNYKIVEDGIVNTKKEMYILKNDSSVKGKSLDDFIIEL